MYGPPPPTPYDQPMGPPPMRGGYEEDYGAPRPSSRRGYDQQAPYSGRRGYYEDGPPPRSSRSRVRAGTGLAGAGVKRGMTANGFGCCLSAGW